MTFEEEIREDARRLNEIYDKILGVEITASIGEKG